MRGERVAQPFRRTDVKHLVVCVSVLCVCVYVCVTWLGVRRAKLPISSPIGGMHFSSVSVRLCVCVCSVVFSTCQCISKGRLD